MTRDLPLLIPACGIWAGALVQSWFLGPHSLFAFWVVPALFLLALLTFKRSFGLFITACFLGSLLLALHHGALQNDFFQAREGKIVTARVVLSSDVRQIQGHIRGDFRQRDSYLVEAKTRSIDDVKISVPVLIRGNQTLIDHIPGDELELFTRVATFSGYSTFAAILTQTGDLKTIRTAPFIWRVTSAVRRDISYALRTLPPDAKALIPGLIVGDRSRQDDDLTQAMRRSGLTHLTAVSGANFAIVAGLLLMVGRRLRIRGKVLWWSIAITLMLFIFLVRPSSSVLRAAVMTGVLLFARAKGVKSSPIPALATAISLLLLINPFYVRDPGFGLSVFATAGLLFLAPRLQSTFTAKKIPQIIAEALAIPMSATICCLPLIVLLSGELSLISIVANLLVAPVIAIITGMGLVLIILAPLSSHLATVLGWIITPFALWITYVARTLSDLPFAALQWPKSWFGSLLMAALLLTIYFFFKKRNRIDVRLQISAFTFLILLSAFEVLRVLSPIAHIWIPRDWKIFQCDVGQGDGLILKAGKGEGVVIDVGPEPSDIDRCLKLTGVTTIKLLVLTHFHADHVAGLSGALRGRHIKQVWVSGVHEPEMEVAQVMSALHGIEVRTPRIGEEYAFRDLELKVMSVQVGVSPNDSSIALLGQLSNISFFAGGDLELSSQEELLTRLKRAPQRSPIDFMKALHHGSAVQIPELIKYLRPRVTFFSVGVNNPYGHPTARALDLYGEVGRIFRTDLMGCLALAKRGGNLIIVTEPASPWAI